MRTIVKTVDGKFYDVSDRQELSLDELNQIVAEVNQEADFLNALVAVAPADPTPPSDPAPTPDPTPPVEQPLPAPVDPTPAPDQPVDPNPPVTLT